MSNYCVCCGDEIPEGMQVCMRCLVATGFDCGNLHKPRFFEPYTIVFESEGEE